MTPPFLERLRRASDQVERAGFAGMLIAPSADLLYLAGYDPPPLERLTCLVIRAQRDPILLVPELERSRARASQVGGHMEILDWSDGEDPYGAAAGIVDPSGTYAASDRMWASHLLGLQRALPEASFVPAGPVLAPLRAVKDRSELDRLSRAARGADETFRRISESPLEGQREEEVAARIGELLREHGHEEVTFAIVASGPNGASPHHEAGTRTLRAGDPVVLDFGGRVGGYCSDLSRTLCVSRSPRGFDEVYGLVREAQEAAFAAVRPGAAAQDVDRAARKVVDEGGYGGRFIHRTGHGIGLEEHEPPYIVEGNEEPLLAGMCFSIEPGVYLEGRFGTRIEDIVAVTEKGAVRLNRAHRELVITA